jgi:hypothetical protein
VTYEQWPQKQKDELHRDVEKFLTHLSAKYHYDFENVVLDTEGSFAFRIVEKPAETIIEHDERMTDAEHFIRAWFKITEPAMELPSKDWSILSHPIAVEFPAPDGETIYQFDGYIVDAECDLYSADPLIVIKNCDPKPKKENPDRPYFELIECHCSQIISFWPINKKHQFKLIDKDGTEKSLKGDYIKEETDPDEIA